MSTRIFSKNCSLYPCTSKIKKGFTMALFFHKKHVKSWMIEIISWCLSWWNNEKVLIKSFISITNRLKELYFFSRVCIIIATLVRMVLAVPNYPGVPNYPVWRYRWIIMKNGCEVGISGYFYQLRGERRILYTFGAIQKLCHHNG